MTRTSLSRSSSLSLSFLSFSSLAFFFSSSSSFVPLAKAMVLPSGDQAGEPAPPGRSVSATASPPWVEMSESCGAFFPSPFGAARTKTTRVPSGDQRGELSPGPLVNGRGASLPSVGAIQRAVS